MSYDHALYCQQIGLKALGFDPGPADGLDGPKTRSALKASAAARLGKSDVPRPRPTHKDKVRVFGEPGREAALKRVTLPWPMKIAWGGGSRKTIRMHKLIADKMVAALQEILDSKGMDFVREYGLDLFGGDFVNRKSRGSKATSDHAWGIALDLNPEANGNYTTWEPGKPAANGTKQMPQEAVAIFQKHGFQVGFKRDSGRRDMMHIAFVDRP